MHGSRREFLRTVPALGGLAAGWASFTHSLSATPVSRGPEDEGFWLMVKRQFPLEDGLVYLNAANVCPASRPVLDRHAELLRDFQANPSYQNRAKYSGLQERLRTKLAEFAGATPEEIAITRNTSEGNNLVVQGIDLGPGDEVIITDHNHPSNRDSWKVRARRHGFEVKSLPVPTPASGIDQLISAVEKAITPRTKVVAITHITNTTGLLFPAKEISELAHRRGLWLHLDGAQSLGAIRVNLHEIGCDSYTASAHKWPMGPLEAGFFYVRAERIPQLWPSIVTAGWSDQLKGARKFEIVGQRDNPRVSAFEAAIDFLNLIGMENVEKRMRFLVAHVKDALRQVPGARLESNLEPELSGGVVKFFLSGRKSREAYDAMWSRHRIAMAVIGDGPAEGLRFSPHVYNSIEELDRAVAAVQELAA